MTSNTKRKRKTKPKLNRLTPVPIPDTWNDDQARAVYNFCSALQELIWRRYHAALIDPMLQKRFDNNASDHIDNPTYPLLLDDAPPL